MIPVNHCSLFITNRYFPFLISRPKGSNIVIACTFIFSNFPSLQGFNPLKFLFNKIKA